MSDLEDQVLQELYSWVDQIPLSKPKKNMARDFADGVLMAEVVKYYFPKLVELHNFPVAHGTIAKKKNWNMLNWKVFKRLNFELSSDIIDSIVACKPGTIERVLLLLRTKIDKNLLAGNGAATAAPATFKRSEAVAAVHPGTVEMAAPAAGVPAAINSTDYVPRLAYEEKVQELLAKDETIKILSAKVTKLDHLLHLKEMRIEELQRKMGESLHMHAAGGQSPRGTRHYYLQSQFAPPPNYGSPSAAYYNVSQQTDRY